jgi:RimJ/RimL family protein N-acetyltransferase
MRTNIKGVIGEIDNLPGCAQIAVSHGVFVLPDMRGQGLGGVAHEARLAEMRRLGYNYVLCTVDGANAAQVRIMQRFNWMWLDEFKSNKTEHTVRLYGRKL